MLDSSHHPVEGARMATASGFRESLKKLKDDPATLNAYAIAEKAALAEYEQVPGMLHALLATLKAQKILIETLGIDPQAHQTFVKAESIALDAAERVTRIINDNPQQREDFITAQRRFHDAYGEALEQPLDNIHALHDFLKEEISVLERNEHKNSILTQAQKEVIHAIQSTIFSLEAQPQALKAFLNAKPCPEEKRHTDTASPLLASHMRVIKAQKAILQTYKINLRAYQAFIEAEQHALQMTDAIYAGLKGDSFARDQFEQFLEEFKRKYAQFLNNPMENMDALFAFLDTEIRMLNNNTSAAKAIASA